MRAIGRYTGAVFIICLSGSCGLVTSTRPSVSTSRPAAPDGCQFTAPPSPFGAGPPTCPP